MQHNKSTSNGHATGLLSKNFKPTHTGNKMFIHVSIGRWALSLFYAWTLKILISVGGKKIAIHQSIAILYNFSETLSRYFVFYISSAVCLVTMVYLYLQSLVGSRSSHLSPSTALLLIQKDLVMPQVLGRNTNISLSGYVTDSYQCTLGLQSVILMWRCGCLPANQSMAG